MTGNFEPESCEASSRLDALAERCRKNLEQGRKLFDGLTPEEVSSVQDRYSRFEAYRNSDGFVTDSTLVITSVHTPRPYLHLMATGHDRLRGILASFLDPSGLGFTALDTVLAGAITSHKDPSYVPTAPRPADCRSFYLREELEGGARIWHLLAQPGCNPESYSDWRSDQNPAFVRISSTRFEIASCLTAFVPVDDPCEVWCINLRNTAPRKRSLKLFVRVNWDLTSYPPYYFDPRIVSSGQSFLDLGALAAFNDDRGNRHPRAGFLMTSEKPAGFDLSWEAFEGGSGHHRPVPLAVELGRCTNSAGAQPVFGLIGALQVDVELAAGADKEIHFILGAATPQEGSRGIVTREEMRRTLLDHRKRHFRPGAIQDTLARTKNRWTKLFSASMARTPDEELDLHANVWYKAQAMHQSRFTRALDKVGLRDVLQDLAGITDINHEYVRERLLEVLSFQMPSGDMFRQYCQFEGCPHDLRPYGDSPAWISDTVVSYVEETGDLSYLDRKVPFYDVESASFVEPDSTVYEHVLRSIKYLDKRRGQKGLCRIGYGDWNDALNGIGRKGEGVSVMISTLLVHAARQLQKLALLRRDGTVASMLERVARETTDAVNTSAWDGHHYIYGFSDDGRAVGTQSDEEGRINLTPNVWAILSGIAEAAGREDAVLDAIRELDTPLGHMLLAPPYTEKSRWAGRIADIQPGLSENGALYLNMEALYVACLVKLGRGDEAYKALRRFLPSSTIPDISTSPPHQLSNYAAGPHHPRFGTHFYSNFTATAGWLRRTISRMLGVIPEVDGLVIDPVIPKSWRQYEVSRNFRGIAFRLTFLNPDGHEKGIQELVANGDRLPRVSGRWLLPVSGWKPGDSVNVEVVMGSNAA